MKTCVLFLCFFTCTLQAHTVDISVSQGYRRDNLKWSISAIDKKPNILSELDYKHMDVYMTHVRATCTHNDFFAKLQGAYGNIYDGKSRDSDYLRDNRKDEFSRSRGAITGDYTFDGAFHIGKRIQVNSTFSLSPMIGYGYYVQKIRMTHGRQSFAFDIFTGEKFLQKTKIHNLNSSYKARWQSPQAGVQANKKITDSLHLFAQYFFLYPLRYKANGHWNLREEPMRRFMHKDKPTKSFGHMLAVGFGYSLTPNWHLMGECELMKFYAKGGHVYILGHKVAPFRKAERTSSEIRLSLGYFF